VKVGDRLIIRNNELIPTDAVLMKGNGSVDYSFVTGESALIEKKEGDKLFAGGRQEGTSIEIEVLKDVKNSYLTQLWNNPIFDKEKSRRPTQGYDGGPARNTRLFHECWKIFLSNWKMFSTMHRLVVYADGVARDTMHFIAGLLGDQQVLVYL
jgi:magnesium-transporting ATPase (P-type)